MGHSIIFNMTTGDNRKEQERTKLNNTIWKIANELRGSVDGWDFKSTVNKIDHFFIVRDNENKVKL